MSPILRLKERWIAAAQARARKPVCEGDERLLEGSGKARGLSWNVEDLVSYERCGEQKGTDLGESADARKKYIVVEMDERRGLSSRGLLLREIQIKRSSTILHPSNRSSTALHLRLAPTPLTNLLSFSHRYVLCSLRDRLPELSKRFWRLHGGFVRVLELAEGNSGLGHQRRTRRYDPEAALAVEVRASECDESGGGGGVDGESLSARD